MKAKDHKNNLKAMDINEIKKIIKEDKVKIIITDQEAPALVVMSYEDYQALKTPESKIEPIRKNIQNPEPRQKEVNEVIETEPLKIEDLPF
ncbi:MAG: hypothetical protein WC534_00070 [Candidatus Paceibacterota bacterium]